jgi:hypothetical protein
MALAVVCPLTGKIASIGIPAQAASSIHAGRPRTPQYRASEARIWSAVLTQTWG